MTCLPWLASLELRGNVVLVAGPPLSGKTTLARTHALKGDVLVDFDFIHAEITGLPLYQRDAEQVATTMSVFNQRAHALKQGFIVQTAAKQSIRAYAHTRHARTIVLEVAPATCIARVVQRPASVRGALRTAINAWWVEYQRDVHAQQRGDEAVLPLSHAWRVA